jgi:H+/gluconate symporter-like permease
MGDFSGTLSFLTSPVALVAIAVIVVGYFFITNRNKKRSIGRRRR